MESAVLKSKIEAILFITSKAMQPIEIAELLGIEEETAQEAIRRVPPPGDAQGLHSLPRLR